MCLNPSLHQIAVSMRDPMLGATAEDGNSCTVLS